jgi:hypothetical protein
VLPLLPLLLLRRRGRKTGEEPGDPGARRADAALTDAEAVEKDDLERGDRPVAARKQAAIGRALAAEMRTQGGTMLFLSKEAEKASRERQIKEINRWTDKGHNEGRLCVG